MEADQNPMPEIDLGITDRIIGVGLALGRLIGRLTAQMTHEPPSAASNHWRSPGDTIKATHQKEWQQELDYGDTERAI